MNVRIVAIVAAACAACSSGMERTPGVVSFTADPAAVFVGDRAHLVAVFDGDSASIDGIGPVRSGVAVETPPLARRTTFTLRVARGGDDVVAAIDVAANYRNRIRRIANAPAAQTAHLAAALPDGRAIVMGGNTSATPNVPDSTLTQIFDPATERFAAGPEMKLTAMAGDRTVLAPLPGRGFLLVGAGVNDPTGADRSVAAQMFDPAAGSFARVGNTVTAGLSARTAAPLADGGALITGGSGPAVSTDRFDPATMSWRAAGAMLHKRVLHTATLLRDGRVLLAGGFTCCDGGTPAEFTTSAEIYDPASGSFTATGSLAAGRGLHVGALLPDGRVLLSGGEGEDAEHPPLGAEIYDPATGQFSPAGSLQSARESHSAVALTDGRVLVIGGQVPPTVTANGGAAVSATEIFDPATGRWSAGPLLDPAFASATITLLGNGKVLVFGGEDPGGFPQSAAALFE